MIPPSVLAQDHPTQYFWGDITIHVDEEIDLYIDSEFDYAPNCLNFNTTWNCSDGCVEILTPGTSNRTYCKVKGVVNTHGLPSKVECTLAYRTSSTSHQYQVWHGYYQVYVEPNKIPVTSITLNKTSLSLQTGQSETLTATVKPDNATDKSVTWSSSNTSVADVSTIGKVTAKSAGSTTITCKANDGSGVKATCAVTVTAMPAPKLVLSASPGGGQVSVGTKVTLTAKANGSTVSGCDIYYTTNGTTPTKSNGTKYASTGIIINNACTLKAIAYKDSYETSDVLTETYTTVDNPADIRFVSVTCDNTDLDNLTQKDKLRMRATFENRGGTDEIYTMLALIDTNNGRILHHGDFDGRDFKAGERTTVEHVYALDTIPTGKYEATILYFDWVEESWMYGGDEFVYNITVNSSVIPVTSITLNKTSLSLQIGQNETLTATVKPDNATDKTVTWISSNDKVATVSAGKVTAVAKGAATITCKANDGSGVKATCAVTVTDPGPDPDPINITDITKYANIVYMEPVTASAGNAITVPVRMKNAQANIMGFQFDLVLPAGITLAKDEDGFYKVDLSADRTSSKKHTVSSQQQADGSVRVVCYSNNNSTFSGTDGNVLELTLNVASSVKEGDYALKLRDMVMTTPSLDSFSVPWVVSKLTIEDYIPGDVNGDGKVDVVDVAGAVNLILNSGDTSKLNRKAADINGDNIINVVDVAGIVNIILNGNTGAKSRTMSSTFDDGQPLLYFNALPIEQGETIALPIMLNTADGSFTGCQFDLYLPEGLSVAEEDGFPLVEVGSGTTARKHTVSTSEQADGSLRVVCYSNNNYTFSGSEILTIAIHADTDAPVGNASVSMRNITLSRPDVTGIDLADYDNELIISSGIEGVIVDQQSDMKVFSLSGQQLDAPRKGVNIVGGKKVVVK